MVHSTLQPPPDLAAFERIAVAVMAFSLAAMNGKPFVASAGFICIIGVVVLTVSLLRRNGLKIVLPASSSELVTIWAVWVFAATVAMVANLQMVTLSEWLWVHLLPFLMLLAFLGLRPSRRDVLLVAGCLVAGWALRYGYAAFVFYQTWGFLGFTETWLAHFNLARNAPYAEATYGNTSITAPLVLMGLIMCGLLLVLLRTTYLIKACLIGALIILAFNAVITGSRALAIVSVLVLSLAGLKSSRRGGVSIFLAVAAAVTLFLRSIDLEELRRITVVFSADRLQDASLQGRMDSIREGFEVIARNPLGIGPGRSAEVSYYTVAHQFAVFQGSETGVLGGLAVTALFFVVMSKFMLARMSPGWEVRFIFRAAAAGWFVFAMIANSPLGLGPNLPWIGTLALIIAMGEVAPGPAPNQGPPLRPV